MSRFLFNVLLAVVWCLLTGSATPWNFLAGLGIGALVLVAYSTIARKGPYLGRLWALLSFGLYFTGLLIKSNWQIAREIVTPHFSQQPRLLRYPVGHLTQTQVTTLGNAITLTPGTLAVDVSPDGQWLYLHCMYAEDPETARRDIDELQTHLMKGVFA